MTCNKFIKAGDCDSLGNVRQLQRTSGKLVDSNFSAIFTGTQGNGLLVKYSLLSLSVLRLTAHILPARQLQQGLSLPCRTEIVAFALSLLPYIGLCVL